MLYEDRMAVATPEGVTLEFALAGVGSRFIATALDLVLQGGAIFVAWFVASGLTAVMQEWAIALGIVLTFVILLGYDMVWETFSSGRTPGKRWTGLRVVREGGGPVTFRVSAVRNLLRLVDFLPSFYVAGMVCVLASSKNQRLGDMAAGTLVVREKQDMAGAAPAYGAYGGYGGGQWMGWTPAMDPRVAEAVSMWDVSGVTAEEVAAVRQFLARRNELDFVARQRLALEFANRLRPKVVMPEQRIGPEGFLEWVVAAKSVRA